MLPVTTSTNAPLPGTQAERVSMLKDAAIELEAGFLAEMLKSAGVGQTPKGFGGGAGEDQFASFLVQAQAKQMARAGGLGLAQVMFESLMERSDV